MHPPRPPSIDQGVQAFIWAALLGAFIWAGLKSVGVSEATAVIVAVVCFVGIFLLVRLFGEDEPRRQPERPRPPDRAA
jgi:sugar phosphate permease